jgi:hypothetical protein
MQSPCVGLSAAELPTVVVQHFLCAAHATWAERLFQSGLPVSLLTLQYRMHPAIARWGIGSTSRYLCQLDLRSVYACSA